MTKRKATNMEVKKNNRNQIFRFVCGHDKVSNPDISYALKLSLPTVTQNTKELIEKGLIEEVGELESTGGRRAKALSVKKDACFAIGLDITKNHIGLLLTNLTGEILKYDRIVQAYRTEEVYFYAVNEKMEQFLEESGVNREKISGIGISFPGIVDLEKQMITYSHILEVQNLPLAEVSRFFAYPCSFFNDANAGALAEGIRMKEDERFFYLSLSNTVGGAILNESKLQQGKAFRCGEVGHMTIVPDGKLCYCGKKGCLDAYCSAKILSGKMNGKLEQFFEKLKQKDPDAKEVWDQYTSYLAIGVNNIHMVLDCDIILGGYAGGYLEPYIPEIWEKVKKRNTFEEERLFIRACSYKIETAALGAALKVIEDFIALV